MAERTCKSFRTTCGLSAMSIILPNYRPELAPSNREGWRVAMPEIGNADTASLPLQSTMLQSGLPPFLEFRGSQLDLFRTKRRAGFNLVNDLFGLFDMTAMAGVRFGQFKPQI